MHFVWKMILNQWPAEKAYYIWAPNQNPFCAICVKNDFESMISWGTVLHLSTKSNHNTSLSLHLPRSHLEFHSLPCCLLLENCVVKICQSIHGWRCTLFLNIKPIHKTSLSPSSLFNSGVCSASVPSGTSGGFGLSTYVKKHKYEFSGIIFLSSRRPHRCNIIVHPMLKEQAEVIQCAVHKKEASKFCAWHNGEVSLP